jgi:flavin-dependent dehydrogenase
MIFSIYTPLNDLKLTFKMYHNNKIYEYLSHLFLLMSFKDLQIYGAGLSGLVSAITLARSGHHVTVYEKEKKIGGNVNCHPSAQMTPLHMHEMERYVGIDLDTCFSKLDDFRGYIDQKKFVFSTKNLYVVERGPRSSSLDYFLYKTAVAEGVTFKFSHPLNLEELRNIPENSIIATAGYSKIVKALRLPYVTFKQFDTHIKTDLENISIAYFGDFTTDYGYISTKNGLLSAQLSGSLHLSQENLNKFTNLVKETEGIDLEGWSSIIAYFPKKARLFTKVAGKTYVLAGDVAGFLDPFFGFGISGALLSGKIAAMSIQSKQKALMEFQQFTLHLNKDLLVHTIYWHLPLKKLLLSQLVKFHDNHLSLVKRSIPGFTDEDWLKIISIVN